MLSSEDRECIYSLAEEITGACQAGRHRHDIIVTNVTRRMDRLGFTSLSDYLHFVDSSDEEYGGLVSAVTIHTTSWFRESPHFDRLEREAVSRAQGGQRMRVLSAACSTGEEGYTAALVLESVRTRFPGFEYEVVGIDLDPVSVQCANRAIYRREALAQIPFKFHRQLLEGSGHTEGLLTLSKEIRSRCRFYDESLLSTSLRARGEFDVVFCRNVLIYFAAPDVSRVVQNLLSVLSPAGMLILGHSEAIEAEEFKLKSLGNSSYCRRLKDSEESGGTLNRKLRVLVVDDSTTVRGRLKKILESNKFEVVAASSADEASEIVTKDQFDVITLDLNMPKVSGQEWLKRERSNGLRVPVVVVSGASPDEALEVLGALENGAQDYLDKASLAKDEHEIVDRLSQLGGQFVSRRSGKGVGTKNRNGVAERVTFGRPDLLLVGASTGGTEALVRLLRHSPKDGPPIVVTQHISPAFARPFAERLANAAGLQLGEPRQGNPLMSGHLYMSFGDYHIGVTDKGGRLALVVSDAPALNRHRPSVDFLFRSASSMRTSKIAAIILTGMGVDGAQGLLELKQKGCMTMAQDEASCVVFGMPREAIKLDAAQFVGTPERIRHTIDTFV